MCPRVRCGSGGGEVGEARRRLDAELGEDVALGIGDRSGLLDGAGGALQRDGVEALKLAGDRAPGLCGLALCHADQEQREQADQDVGSDALLEAVEDRAQTQGALEVAEGALCLERVLPPPSTVASSCRGRLRALA